MSVRRNSFSPGGSPNRPTRTSRRPCALAGATPEHSAPAPSARPATEVDLRNVRRLIPFAGRSPAAVFGMRLVFAVGMVGDLLTRSVPRRNLDVRRQDPEHRAPKLL